MEHSPSGSCCIFTLAVANRPFWPLVSKYTISWKEIYILLYNYFGPCFSLEKSGWLRITNTNDPVFGLRAHKICYITPCVKCSFTHASRAGIRIFTLCDIKFRTILVRKTFSWRVWLHHSSEKVLSHSYCNVLFYGIGNLFWDSFFLFKIFLYFCLKTNLLLVFILQLFWTVCWRRHKRARLRIGRRLIRESSFSLIPLFELITWGCRW